MSTHRRWGQPSRPAGTSDPGGLEWFTGTIVRVAAGSARVEIGWTARALPSGSATVRPSPSVPTRSRPRR